MSDKTLHDLEIGDIFYPASKIAKATPLFRVTGKPEFNIRHGSPTRMCLNMQTREYVSKSCRLKVIKTNTL